LGIVLVLRRDCSLKVGQSLRLMLRATYEGALAYCFLTDLKRFAVDLA
jgi:hypothetical protein